MRKLHRISLTLPQMSEWKLHSHYEYLKNFINCVIEFRWMFVSAHFRWNMDHLIPWNCWKPDLFRTMTSEIIYQMYSSVFSNEKMCLTIASKWMRTVSTHQNTFCGLGRPPVDSLIRFHSDLVKVKPSHKSDSRILSPDAHTNYRRC